MSVFDLSQPQAELRSYAISTNLRLRLGACRRRLQLSGNKMLSLPTSPWRRGGDSGGSCEDAVIAYKSLKKGGAHWWKLWSCCRGLQVPGGGLGTMVEAVELLALPTNPWGKGGHTGGSCGAAVVVCKSLGEGGGQWWKLWRCCHCLQ